MANRIYLVTVGEIERLVEAANKAQAVSFVTKDTIKAELASQEDLVRLVREGALIEVYTTEEE